MAGPVVGLRPSPVATTVRVKRLLVQVKEVVGKVEGFLFRVVALTLLNSFIFFNVGSLKFGESFVKD